MTATDEGGRSVRSAVEADGRFSLVLSKGHTYKLAMTTPKGDVPIVFPRTTGKLKRTFALRSDGAAIRLGSVRYLGKAPAGGFHVMSASIDGGASGESGGDNQETNCEGSDGEKGAEQNGAEQNGAESESASGPQEGTDTQSGADANEEADASSEMAVGEQNAPEQVGACGGDGGASGTTEGESVQQEQEGEH